VHDTNGKNGTVNNPTVEVINGQGILKYWSKVGAGSAYGLLEGNEASTSGMYTGMWFSTFIVTPNNPFTPPPPPPGGGPADGGGVGNWPGPDGPPNAPCAFMYFGEEAANKNVHFSSPVTVGTIVFNSDAAYALTGAKLTLDCTSPMINLTKGSHTIANPVELAASDTRIDVVRSQDTLTFSNSLTVASGVSANVEKVGEGKWKIKRFQGNKLDVKGGTVQMNVDRTVTGTSKVKELNVIPETGAKLDLAENHLVVDYTSSSPVDDIARWVQAGYASGAWTGPGIGSSAAATATLSDAIGYAEASAFGHTVFGGESVDSTSLLLRYTLAGDANLDGSVNFTDLVAMSQNYDEPGTFYWWQGDFNHDGTVNFSDQVLLSQNYNTSLPSGASPAFAMAEVPEPALAGALVGIGLVTLMRRRRTS
jgi:hypothetical protein